MQLQDRIVKTLSNDSIVGIVKSYILRYYNHDKQCAVSEYRKTLDGTIKRAENMANSCTMTVYIYERYSSYYRGEQISYTNYFVKTVEYKG